jgi:hypothetical protein
LYILLYLDGLIVVIKLKSVNIVLILFLLSLSSISLFTIKEYLVSAVINVGEPDPRITSPYSKYEGAPEIVIKNDDYVYHGALRVFNLVTGDVNNNMPSIDSNSNVTSIMPENAINVSQNERIQLLIQGNPKPELQPNSLSATVYFSNGTGFKVLSLAESSKRDTFNVDLPTGKYIVLATATWLPNPDYYLTTSGYVVYAFRMNVL